MSRTSPRSRTALLAVLLLWVAFYASWTLVRPPLLDDADSVHAEVAREMIARHDPVTLYANGIRYLEKAPLMYWSMAAAMRAAQAMGAGSADGLTIAARLPLALTVLALALLCATFARRMFASPRAGLYAALVVLSSPGFFLFSRITLPDVMVCLWLSWAMLCFWRAEEAEREGTSQARFRFGFAAACALNVLTKGLIGVVFPVAIVVLYVLLTRGLRGGLRRLRSLPSWPAVALFFAMAAPWHIAAGLANPAQGHPAPFRFVGGHWQVPLPTDGNVRGWWWFYFMNEHLLRYLNLRVPRDYDTAPLWLFWGLCLVWLMPWSAFALAALGKPLHSYARALRQGFKLRQGLAPRQGITSQQEFTLWHAPSPAAFPALRSSRFLLCVWAGFTLLFFSLSTRQEYYVLPALPAVALLVAGWLAAGAQHGRLPLTEGVRRHRRIWSFGVAFWLVLGAVFAMLVAIFLLHGKTPAPGTDLALLLQGNPGEYALSMGHFLDLNAQAMGLFRVPLAIAAAALLGGPLAAMLLMRRGRAHAANLTLAAGAFGFLLAVHLGLQTFAPVITSAQLAKAIAPQVRAGDLVVLHGEYEAGSTLGFYLQRSDLHILEGRSSNLWYGSFFPDAPPRFETPQSLAAKWNGPQRIWMWQSTGDEPRSLPPLPGPAYVVAASGGKEIVSNRPGSR